jgi:putative transposase
MNTLAKEAVTGLVGDDVVTVARGCELFSLARSSYYYQPVLEENRLSPGGGIQPRALSDEEETMIRQVFTELLDEGVYLASARTFARVLTKHGQSADRQLQRADQPKAAPVWCASKPNDRWSWDTSPLPMLIKGVFCHLYVILDVYSRFAISWGVHLVESSAIAETMFRDAAAHHRVDTKNLGVHSDNGPIQRSLIIAEAFSELGITKSHSRPHVSNDNPYSESLFKTAKYQVEYPGKFDSLDQARAWAEAFFTYYNYDHYHSGIAMLTPASVFHGTHIQIIKQRQNTLNASYAKHPERFPNGAPVAKKPQPAWINKPADPHTITEEQIVKGKPMTP